MLTFTPDDGFVQFSIDYDRFDCHDLRSGTGRWSYKCTITVDGKTINAGPVHSAASNTQSNPTRLGEMLATFLNFFSAYIEAQGYPDSENQGLFPESCRELAESLDSSQVSLWAEEIFNES